MIDNDVARTERVDRVGVGRLRRQDANVAKDKVIRVVRHDLPETGVLYGDTLHANVFGMVEDYSHRPRMVGTETPGVGNALDIVPPYLAVAVDDPFACD